MKTSIIKKKSPEEKSIDFIKAVYQELVIDGNTKIRIRKLVTFHKTGDSSRKALFDLGIISNPGSQTSRKYSWLVGEISEDLLSKYLYTIKMINKETVRKRLIREKCR